MVGMVRFEARIQELVETIPDLAILVEPLLVVRRALREQIIILQGREPFSNQCLQRSITRELQAERTLRWYRNLELTKANPDLKHSELSPCSAEPAYLCRL
jgi:hypothetical protein